MNIGVMGDIHGNFDALKAVLSDAFSEGVERILVNGDLVNRGPNNAAVVEYLYQIGASIVLGNHDDLVVKWADRDPSLQKAFYRDPIWDATGWCVSQLNASESLDKLRRLPKILSIETEMGQTVLISHGSPRDLREGLGIDTPDSKIVEIIEPYKAGVVIGSHTHMVMERQVSRKKVINTGSVGAPFDNDPRAAYVILRNLGGEWRIEFRRVAYDRDSAMGAFKTTGFLAEGGLSAQIFLTELKYAKSFFTPFIKWCSKLELDYTGANWLVFRDSCW